MLHFGVSDSDMNSSLMQTQILVADETHWPGTYFHANVRWSRLKEKGGNESRRSGMGRERGKQKGDCMQRAGERTEGSFYSMRHRIVKGGCRASSASDDRCQRKEDGWRNDSYLSDIDEEEIAG